jgi:hypothetical protein
LRLPAELRNRIYEYGFGDTSARILPRGAIRVPLHPDFSLLTRTSSSGLIFACSQTYFEALPVFYTYTTFIITSLYLIEGFALALRSSNAARIQTIEVDGYELLDQVEWKRDYRCCARPLGHSVRHFLALQCVKIRCEQAEVARRLRELGKESLVGVFGAASTEIHTRHYIMWNW